MNKISNGSGYTITKLPSYFMGTNFTQIESRYICNAYGFILSAKRYIEHFTIFRMYKNNILTITTKLIIFLIHIFSISNTQFSPYNRFANLFTSVSPGWLFRTRIICPSSSHMSLSILKRLSYCSLLIELC